MNQLLPSWADSFGQTSLSIKQTNPNDSDVSVADTVALMGSHAREASATPQVKEALQAAGVLQAGLTEDEVIERVFSYIKGRIQFVEDPDQLEGIFQNPNGKELLITPPVLLSMQKPMGDCDDFSMLACSMLMAKGIKCDFVTIAANQNAPSEFSHVYCMAGTRDGRVIPFDASHGKEAGWESARAYRKQIWPVFNWAGDRRGMGGGGMVVSKGLGVIDGSRSAFDKMFDQGLKGILGLGDDTTDIYSGIDSTLTQLDTLPPSDVNVPYDSNNGISVSSPPAATGGVNWNSILQSITGTIGKIAVQTTQPAGVSTTTCNAQGVCSQSSTVLPANYTGSLNIPGLNTSSLGSMLPLLLIAGVAFFAFSEMDRH